MATDFLDPSSFGLSVVKYFFRWFAISPLALLQASCRTWSFVGSSGKTVLAANRPVFNWRFERINAPTPTTSVQRPMNRSTKGSTLLAR
jgi:hypothetical protein